MVKALKSAMVLSAGFGTRLQPLTDFVPKPLLEVMAQPILGHILDQLEAQGVERICVNAHHLSEQIESYIESRKNIAAISVSVEQSILGTAGALRYAQKFLEQGEEECFLVLNGDSLCQFDLAKAHACHVAKNAFSTVGLKKVQNPAKYGAITTDESDRVVSFANYFISEAPFSQERMFCGLSIFDKSVFEYLPKPGQYGCRAKDLYPAILTAQKPVYAVEVEGDFFDVGTAGSLLRCNAHYLAGSSKRSYVSKSATLGQNVCIGANVIVGSKAHIGSGASLSNSVVFSGAQIKANESLDGILVAKQARLKTTPQPA